jgi:hypothetical protein
MEMIRDRSFQSCFYENASLRLLAPPQEWKTQPVTGRPKKSTKEPPAKTRLKFIFVDFSF